MLAVPALLAAMPVGVGGRTLVFVCALAAPAVVAAVADALLRRGYRRVRHRRRPTRTASNGRIGRR